MRTGKAAPDVFIIMKPTLIGTNIPTFCKQQPRATTSWKSCSVTHSRVGLVVFPSVTQALSENNSENLTMSNASCASPLSSWKFPEWNPGGFYFWTLRSGESPQKKYDAHCYTFSPEKWKVNHIKKSRKSFLPLLRTGSPSHGGDGSTSPPSVMHLSIRPSGQGVFRPIADRSTASMILCNVGTKNACWHRTQPAQKCSTFNPCHYSPNKLFFERVSGPEEIWNKSRSNPPSTKMHMEKDKVSLIKFLVILGKVKRKVKKQSFYS